MLPQRTSNIPHALVEVGTFGYLLTFPFGQFFPSAIRQVLILVVIGGLVATQLAAPVEQRKRHYHFTSAVVFFFVVSLCAVGVSAFPVLSLKSSQYLPVGMVFFFAAQVVSRSSRSIQRFATVVALLILMVAVDVIVQMAVGHSVLASKEPRGTRAVGSLPHPNDIGLVAILLPIPIAVLMRGSARTLLVGGGLIAVVAIALVASQSRNAWLGAASGVTITFLLMGSRRRLVIAGAIALAIGLLAWSMDFANFRDRVDSLGSFLSEGRTGLWLAAWSMFQDAPLTGQGPHVFGLLYLPHLSQIEFPAGYSPEVAYIPWAHNLYLEMLAERGILGLSAFLYAMIGGLVLIGRALKNAGSGVTWAYGCAITASVSTIAIMGVFDLTFLKDWCTLVFWLLIGCCGVYPSLCRTPTANPRHRDHEPDGSERCA